MRGDDSPTKRLFGGFSAWLPPSLVRGAVECLHSKTNLLSSERLINVAVAAAPSALNPSSISLSRGRSGRRERSDERGGQGGEWRGKTQDTCAWPGGERSHFKFACRSARGKAEGRFCSQPEEGFVEICPEIVSSAVFTRARAIFTKTKEGKILLN